MSHPQLCTCQHADSEHSKIEFGPCQIDECDCTGWEFDPEQTAYVFGEGA